MVRTDRSASNFSREHVKSEEGETDRINNAAFALPVLAKNVILAWQEIQAGA